MLILQVSAHKLQASLSRAHYPSGWAQTANGFALASNVCPQTSSDLLYKLDVALHTKAK